MLTTFSLIIRVLSARIDEVVDGAGLDNYVATWVATPAIRAIKRMPCIHAWDRRRDSALMMGYDLVDAADESIYEAIKGLAHEERFQALLRGALHPKPEYTAIEAFYGTMDGGNPEQYCSALTLGLYKEISDEIFLKIIS